MANEIIIQAFEKKDLKTVNTELVKMFNCCNRDITMLMSELSEIDKVKTMSRATVIGKLGYMGEKNIVPKVEKVKKDTGPTKKELFNKVVVLLGCAVGDIDTFNNVKKSQLQFLITFLEMELADE